jgi:purine nucleoside phosphorylase
MDWSRAKLFDFTGASSQGTIYSRFGKDVMEALRQPTDCKLAIILDTGFGWESKAPALVQDHINLSGFNPLIGPNHPIGERFPVVQGIYISDCAGDLGLEPIIVAGIKNGRTLSLEDADFMHILGAACYCFNTVPTMLIAAHAGWKVLAIVGPDNRSWQAPVLEKVRKITTQLQESVS